MGANNAGFCSQPGICAGKITAAITLQISPAVVLSMQSFLIYRGELTFDETG